MFVLWFFLWSCLMALAGWWLCRTKDWLVWKYPRVLDRKHYRAQQDLKKTWADMVQRMNEEDKTGGWFVDEQDASTRTPR